MPSASVAREKILRAAFDLFAEKGYAGATTREIAQRAGVNEVTIFRQFGSKEILFQEGIELHSPVSMLTAELQERLTGDDVRANLEHLAEQYLAIAVPSAKVIHIGMAEASRDPELHRMTAQIPQRLESHLADYLEALRAKGEVRQRDYAMLAHLFYSMLLRHALTSSGAPASMQRPDIPDAGVAKTLADLFACYLQTVDDIGSTEGGTP